MSYKIPLISKMPDVTGLPEFYDSAKGCKVKIGNKEYLDFSVIGASACILGYSDNYVNYYVKKCINNGSFSSLNSRYMNKLTNLLLAIHPDLDMVRYGKCAGEMLLLAMQLAMQKIYTPITFENGDQNNYKIIFQIGYNGWLIKNKLDDKYPVFNKNKYIHFENINEILNEKLERNEIPNIVIFELLRHEFPKLEVVKKLKEWQKQGTILILDEVTTGFRFNVGGVYQKYDLKPDMIIYAKGISNGFPMACIIGKKEIMESNMWVSSTYWSDSIGFVAAYHTVKKLKHCDYRLLVKLGQSIMKIWDVCAKKHNIKIKIGEVPNIANFEFLDEKKLELKSLFIQEMQKERILALTSFYPTFAHNSKSVGQYAKACDIVFGKLRKYLDGEKFEFKLLKEIKK